MDRVSPLSRRRTWRDGDPLPKLLKEWYGDAVSRDIIRERLPREVGIGDAVDAVMAKLVTPEGQEFQRLHQDWAELVGEPVARVSEPHHLHRGVLYVSVKGAAMLMELSRFHADTILAKVREHSGEDFCTLIRFVAEG